MAENFSVNNYQYIETDPGLIFIPSDDESYAVFNPSTSSIARVSGSTVKMLLYARIPHTIESLWDRFPSADENDQVGFKNTVEKLMEDGFLYFSGSEKRPRNKISKPEVPDNPSRIIVHLTYKCNLNCKYCYNSEVRALSQIELSYRDWVEVFSRINSSGVNSVIITGGEPLLRKDVFPLISELRNNGIMTTLGTNGTIIEKNDLELINNAFNEVNISIDSYKSTEHDINRGCGTHDKCVATAKLLTEYEIPWRAQMTYNIDNYQSHAKTNEFVKELGAMELVVSVDTSSEIAKEYMKHYMRPKQWVISDARKMSPIELSNSCPAGYTLCALDPNGCIYPCHMLLDTEFKGMSILQNEFNKAWMKSECLNALRQFDLMNIEECGNCEFAGLCNGGCRGVAYAESGNINGFVGHTHCRLLKWTVFEKIRIAEKH